MVSKKIGERIKLSAACDVMHQTFHLLTNQGAGIPVEYRIPALSYAPPEKSNQYSLGASYFPNNHDIQISIDLYSKQLSNLVTLKDGVNYSSSYKDWENIIWKGGTGKSKGIEILIRKPTGKTTGWIGATFANSERKFEELNKENTLNTSTTGLSSLNLFSHISLTKRYLQTQHGFMEPGCLFQYLPDNTLT